MSQSPPSSGAPFGSNASSSPSWLIHTQMTSVAFCGSNAFGSSCWYVIVQVFPGVGSLLGHSRSRKPGVRFWFGPEMISMSISWPSGSVIGFPLASKKLHVIVWVASCGFVSVSGSQSSRAGRCHVFVTTSASSGSSAPWPAPWAASVAQSASSTSLLLSSSTKKQTSSVPGLLPVHVNVHCPAADSPASQMLSASAGAPDSLPPGSLGLPARNSASIWPPWTVPPPSDIVHVTVCVKPSGFVSASGVQSTRMSACSTQTFWTWSFGSPAWKTSSFCAPSSSDQTLIVSVPAVLLVYVYEHWNGAVPSV